MLEGVSLSPISDVDLADTIKELCTTTLTSKVFKQMVEARTQFHLEDLCHILRDKGYWCRIREEGMMAQIYNLKNSWGRRRHFYPCLYLSFFFWVTFSSSPLFLTNFMSLQNFSESTFTTVDKKNHVFCHGITYLIYLFI